MTQQVSVLVVVESRTFALYLGLLLRRMGFKARIAGSSTAAEKILTWEKVDFLLLGTQAGDAPVIPLANRLRQISPAPDLPFIVLADRRDETESKACLEAGCRGYLLKPVQPRKLHEALQANMKLPSGPRVNLRASIGLSAEVSVGDGEPGPRRVFCLSRGGALIAFPESLPTGTKISLVLPTEEELLPLQGTVIYNRVDLDDSESRAFAVLFHRQSLCHADKIEAFLESLLEKECLQAARLQEQEESRTTPAG